MIWSGVDSSPLPWESRAIAYGVSSPCERRHGRACPGHPRLPSQENKTWMPGTSPGTTMRKRQFQSP
ncbi:hypothetical protein CWS35_14630 [Bradyrhizobium sp. SK17]|nr:hypothetical protein CWS35_14630 [Bradyrhizobium sp. SK17]